MPNRILKESICTSDNLNNLSPNSEILFYRLIVNCDDYGRCDARSSVIRSKCFPLKLDNIKDSDITAWLAELDNNNLLILYETDGKKFLQLTTWDGHQRIRAKRSKYPAPIDSELLTYDSELQTSADICVRNPIQSNPNPNPNPNPNNKGIEIPDWLNGDIWGEFLTHRKQIKKPATPRAQELLIKKLSDMQTAGENIQQVIEQSIMNGWIGLFPVKSDRSNGSGKYRGNNEKNGAAGEGYSGSESGNKYTTGKYGSRFVQS